MPYLDLFKLEFQKTIVIYDHILNQFLRIFLIGKFREKTKMSKFGTEKALFGFVWG